MRSLSTRTAGLLILALGIWGGLIPFVGPYFHFVLGIDKSWTWTTSRLYLDVLPALAAVLGGLMLIGAGPRPSARLGALLAIAAGIWFAIGPDVSHLWNAAGAEGAAHGSRTVRTLEMLAYHTGLGALLAALGGYALPRFVAAREVVAEPAATVPPARRVGGRTAAAEEPVAGEAVPAGRETDGERREEPVAQREAETAAIPVREPETSALPAREPETAAMPAREPETAAMPAGEAPLARDDGEEPADAGEPAAGPSTGAPDARTGESAGAMPPEATGGPYGGRTHTVRRRRGGLLSALFPRR
jgi:hypothetical protein